MDSINWLGGRAAKNENLACDACPHPESAPRVKLKYPEILFAKDDAEKLPYVLRDEFRFGIVRIGNGERHLIGGEALQALRESEERKFQPPNIQILLKTAQTLRRALDCLPETSRAKLAREMGITRARMTQILGLLNLAPEIQDYILSMPPVNGRSPISERGIRPVTLVENHGKQVRMFAMLVSESMQGINHFKASKV